jgi:hypothetical protein
MNRERLIESARGEHQRKVKERIEDPKDDLLGSILLYSKDDSLQYIALLLDYNDGLQEYLRKLRLMLEAKIYLEGAVASVHTADVFLAEIQPERAAEINHIARTDPRYLETAEKRGLVRNRDAIVTTVESAWVTTLIRQFYSRQSGRVILEEKEELFDVKVPKTPFTGFDWSKVN